MSGHRPALRPTAPNTLCIPKSPLSPSNANSVQSLFSRIRQRCRELPGFHGVTKSNIRFKEFERVFVESCKMLRFIVESQVSWKGFFLSRQSPDRVIDIMHFFEERENVVEKCTLRVFVCVLRVPVTSGCACESAQRALSLSRSLVFFFLLHVLIMSTLLGRKKNTEITPRKEKENWTFYYFQIVLIVNDLEENLHAWTREAWKTNCGTLFMSHESRIPRRRLYTYQKCFLLIFLQE